MKKFSMFGMAVIAALLLCVLTGCPDEEQVPIPASMTFVDNKDIPAKEFSIDENFNFKVTFINPNQIDKGFQIQPGDQVSGKITDTGNKAWNNDLTGAAVQMASTNPTIGEPISDSEFQVAISLVYTKDGEAITSVKVDFPGTGGVSPVAKTLMANTYYRK